MYVGFENIIHRFEGVVNRVSKEKHNLNRFPRGWKLLNRHLYLYVYTVYSLEIFENVKYLRGHFNRDKSHPMTVSCLCLFHDSQDPHHEFLTNALFK